MFDCICCLGKSFSTEKLLTQHRKGKKHIEKAAAVALDAEVAKTISQKDRSSLEIEAALEAEKLKDLAQRDRSLSEAAAALAVLDDQTRAADSLSLAQRDRSLSEAAESLEAEEGETLAARAALAASASSDQFRKFN